MGSDCRLIVRRGGERIEVQLARTSPRGLAKTAVLLHLLERHASLLKPGKDGEAPPWRAMSSTFDAVRRHAVETESERLRCER